jgi:cell division protein FtsB
MEGMIIGTVDYISPEQCDDSGTVDVRSDLYSLGCTFYCLLTGQPVYSSAQYDTIRKKLMGHIVGEVPSLRRKLPGLPMAIEAFLKKVLSKKPAERFQTPIEFAEAIAPFASFEELWTLTCEAIPPDPTEPRSSARQSSSPYGFAQLSKQNIVPPVRRSKWFLFLVMLNLLAVGLVVGTVHYVVNAMRQVDREVVQQAEQRKALWEEAERATETARKLRDEWNIAEAKAEYRKAIQIAVKEYAMTHDAITYDIAVLKFLEQARTDYAMLQWYHGDPRGAGYELLAIQNTIDAQLELNELSETELSPLRMRLLELRGDLMLFGSAASGQNVERWANGIARYHEAVRARVNDPRSEVIRWKLAILYALYGNKEEAKTLLAEHPLPNGADIYSVLVHELAEAVLFYGLSEGEADRDQKLRTFLGQFTLQGNPAREAMGQPDIVELLVFCAEYLLSVSIQNEDWETLAKDKAAIIYITNHFMRQYPGSTPFMRRFDELLIHSAALLHEKLERPGDKREQISNIVRLLDRMRPRAEAEVSGMQRPTLIYFFLPSTTTEQGFVVFYPQDGRPGTLHHLPLTRQMVKQPLESGTFPELDADLLKQIEAEKAAGRRIRISWNDATAWARPEDALSEAEYPYKEVLSLQ